MEIIFAIIGSGALSALIAGIFNLINNKMQRKSIQSKLLMGMAYSKIIETAERYIQQGYIPTDEYKELEHYFYMPYKEMGGNGTAQKLMAEVAKLPSAKSQKGGK